MGMKALDCPNCGANVELDESREFGFCSYCGTKIIQEKIVIEHRVNVDCNADCENFLKAYATEYLLFHGSDINFNNYRYSTLAPKFFDFSYDYRTWLLFAAIIPYPVFLHKLPTDFYVTNGKSYVDHSYDERRYVMEKTEFLDKLQNALRLAPEIEKENINNFIMRINEWNSKTNGKNVPLCNYPGYQKVEKKILKAFDFDNVYPTFKKPFILSILNRAYSDLYNIGYKSVSCRLELFDNYEELYKFIAEFKTFVCNLILKNGIKIEAPIFNKEDYKIENFVKKRSFKDIRKNYNNLRYYYRNL